MVPERKIMAAEAFREIWAEGADSEWQTPDDLPPQPVEVTLVTDNLREFSRIPDLLLENWLSDSV